MQSEEEKQILEALERATEHFGHGPTKDKLSDLARALAPQHGEDLFRYLARIPSNYREFPNEKVIIAGLARADKPTLRHPDTQAPDPESHKELRAVLDEIAQERKNDGLDDFILDL